MAIPVIKDEYNEVIEQLENDYAMLFLGAGSSAMCLRPDGKRGLTGQQLADEIITDLNGGKPIGFSINLTQASEFYTAQKASARRGLDRLVQERLTDLQPTIGHFIAASFPWRALVTTNYNRVIEDAWHVAHANGYAAREQITIRTDGDITNHAGDSVRMRLYKPHGCVTIQEQRANRMVLTSLDYFESERIRKEMYKAIRSIAQDCSTVFVGYSLQDYTFRNIFYTLFGELGQWANRSYNVGPLKDSNYEKWLGRSMEENFKTSVINETFDTFMIRLAIARKAIHPKLRDQIISNWKQIEKDNVDTIRDLDISHIQSLPNL